MCSEYPGHRCAGLIGRGSFGEAYLYMDEVTDGLTVVKFLRNIDDRLEEYVKRELRNHQRLSGHPAIVQLKEVYLADGRLAVAMEFAAGGTLQDRIAKAGRFSEDTARYFFQQLVQAVAWCHSKGVVHRDLKLENLLLDRAVPDEALWDLRELLARQPHIKLCDFGCSKSSDLDSRPDTLVGTPAFTAPELFVRSGKHYSGEAVDVWACGVTLYFMLVGDVPFRDPQNNRVAPQLIFQARWSIPEGIEVSKGCHDLLSRIFEADPQHRITLEGIQKHPWFRKQLPKARDSGQEGHRKRMPRWLHFLKGGSSSAHGSAAASAAAAAPEPEGPAGLGRMNQSEEEIDHLIKQARIASASARFPGSVPGQEAGSEAGSLMGTDLFATGATIPAAALG